MPRLSLMDQGMQVRQINNLTLNRYRQLFGQPYKTDEYDARLIASFLQQPLDCKNVNYQENQLIPVNQMNIDIKKLARHQMDLTKGLIRFKNKLKKMILSYLPELLDVYDDIFSPNCLALIALGKTPVQLNKMKLNKLAQVKSKNGSRGIGLQKAQELKTALREIYSDLFDSNSVNAKIARNYALNIYEIHQQIKDLDQELASLLRIHPQGSNLLSVPGIGIKIAARIIGETVDVKRFKTLDKYSAYSGVVCLRNDSGRSKRARNTKQSNRILKDSYMKAALTSIRINSASKTYYDKKIQAGHGHLSALKCLAHQISKVVYKLMKTNSCYQESFYQKAA